MCLLTFVPEYVEANEEALLNGAITNDDGHGFAVVGDGELIVGHDLDVVSCVESFMMARKRYPDRPAMFHSRFGTAGRNGLDNCHPFYVGNDARTVVAHNGVFNSDTQPKKGDPRCDTRILAEDVIPNMKRKLNSRRMRRDLERWMGWANKMVILSVDRSFRDVAYILNESSGIWETDGCWYSNSGYLDKPYNRATWLGSSDAPMTGWDDDDSAKWWKEKKTPYCEGCGQKLSQRALKYGSCTICLVCVDCWEWPEDCQCYTPASLDVVMGRQEGNRYAVT